MANLKKLPNSCGNLQNPLDDSRFCIERLKMAQVAPKMATVLAILGAIP
jgi:hypothetical protein